MENKTLMDCLSVVTDPRIDRMKRHNLIDILVIAICGVLSGFDTWVDIGDYAKEKKEWFSQFLELPHGIPSHDTFGRVFSLLKPGSFQSAFFEWLESLRGNTKLINIDGKVIKGAIKKSGKSKSPLLIVNAWASEVGVCLGQIKAKDRDEKEAMEKLVENLFVKGCIVTLDAGGATINISQKIIDEEGDYLIALKGNQSILHEFAQKSLIADDLETYETKENSHGRKELREYTQYNILDNIDFEMAIKSTPKEIRKLFHDWPHAKSFISVKAHRTFEGEISEETRYYISSLENNVEKAAHAIRSHWGIENSLHYILDVTFREDHSRMRIKYAAENMALLRRMALNMLKKQDPEMSIRRKRNKCNWSNEYLEQTLFAQIQN